MSNHIKELILENNMTVTEAVKCTGLSTACIQDLSIKPDKRPRNKTAEKLAYLFKVDPTYITGEVYKESPLVVREVHGGIPKNDLLTLKVDIRIGDHINHFTKSTGYNVSIVKETFTVIGKTSHIVLLERIANGHPIHETCTYVDLCIADGWKRE